MSLGEILSLVKNGGLGAGLAQGLAEDAGKTAAWVVGAGLDDGTAVAEALDAAAGRCRRDRLCEACAACMSGTGGTAAAAGSAFCLAPLAVDQLCAARDGERLALGPIDVPLLVVALAAWRSKQVPFALALGWSKGAERVAALCRQGAVSIAATDRGAVAMARQLPLGMQRLDRGEAGLEGPLAFTEGELADRHARAIEAGATLAKAAQQRILAHAAQSYVASSETSRRAGAGAGLIDRD